MLKFLSSGRLQSYSQMLYHLADQRRGKLDKAGEFHPRSSLDSLKTKQNIINRMAAYSIPGFRKVQPKACQKTLVLEGFRSYLKKHCPVQIPQGCLLKVIHTIDRWNKRKTLFDQPHISAILSGEKSFHECGKFIEDPNVRMFLEAHLSNIRDLTDDQKQRMPTDKYFIRNYMQHSILTDIYVSAKELEDHFKMEGQPIYSMVCWGRSEIERGYQIHAILVFGVDVNDNIHFWDVSDQLPRDVSRMRKMSIDEFNDRRNIPPRIAGLYEGSMFRSRLYFYKKE